MKKKEHEIHREFLEGLDKEEEEKPSVLKKVLPVVIGIFLLFLILSYFVGGPYTLDIIESMLSSSKMEQFVVKGDGFDVVFDALAYSQLKEYYLENQKYEFKACLGGEIDSDTYIVKEILYPTQKGSFSQVTYVPCPAETIVSLHSHPYRRCRASEQDFISFEKFRETAPDAVMIVMCEADRFYVYR